MIDDCVCVVGFGPRIKLFVKGEDVEVRLKNMRFIFLFISFGGDCGRHLMWVLNMGTEKTIAVIIMEKAIKALESGPSSSSSSSLLS